MKKKRISLAGSIADCWINEKCPAWGWDGLLQRTIDTDIELDRNGHNPAPKFRELRLTKDLKKMRKYIGGFNKYPYSPNHRE